MRFVEFSRHYTFLGIFEKCGELTYLFVTNVANVKILLDIADLEEEINEFPMSVHINVWSKKLEKGGGCQ